MWSKWKEAVFLALVAALFLEFAINAFEHRTIWHRMTSAEERLDRIESQPKK